MKKIAVTLTMLACLCIGNAVFAGSLNLKNKEELKAKLTAETISLKAPETVKLWPEKTFRYQVIVWGSVEADVEDFKTKVAETYKDQRGWSQIAVFKEVTEDPDFYVILSDAASLDATPGCSGELSCTTWSDQVIINDLRWREGTEASRNAGMSTRDYQHMVVNHETGHWLGHYAHEEKCDAGGPAPVMLQQSTGLRGCDSFNAWPLEFELWTLK